MGIRRHVVLLDTAAADTGEWFRLDSRYEEDAVRAFQVALTAGDTISIEATTYDVRGATADITADIATDDITAIESFDISGNGVLAGNWTFVRAVKTGTTANAKVQGFI